MRDASDASATCSPPRLCTTQSATLSARRAGRELWRESHASLASVHMGDANSPVRRENAAAPNTSASSAASSSPRLSCHAIDGATGEPSSPSRTTVSAMLVTPRPTTCPGGAASRASPIARAAAPRRSAGSVSAPSGTALQGVGALPQEISWPSRPTTAALVLVVPMSRPTSSSVRPSGLGARSWPRLARTAGPPGSARRSCGALPPRHRAAHR